MTCRFVSATEPRVIAGRHATPCTCDDRELGCLPCPETHCVICGKAHAKAACTACLDAARNDLDAIWHLLEPLGAEAVNKGVYSEAMMLDGPAADPEAWQHHAMSAIRGRLCKCIQRGQLCPSLWGRTCPDAAYLDDNRDEQHPLTVLGGWEQVWRDHLDHYTEATVTLESAYRYLGMQIGYMSEQLSPSFDDFAREVRTCRAHLEDVLHDGIRDERGAPCVQCERKMVKIGDDWHCRTCRRTVTEEQYRFAVGAAYRAISDRLTAADMALQLGMKASVIRVWGSRGYVRKRGKNHEGLTLYDVSDVLERKKSEEKAS